MAMAVGGSSGSGVRANINMTPMIDILLVLLIIFMAISPVAPKGLEALAPQPSRSEMPDAGDRAVVISVTKDHQWKLNQEAIQEDRLEARLVEIFKTRQERVVFVKGDPELEFNLVARAIDHAHGALIDKVGLMTPKVEEGK